MKAEQGYVHIPLTAGSADGLTITPTESASCARCAGHGGDMVIFTCDTGVPNHTLRRMCLHVSCMESLTYMYRTGRKLPARKGGA